MCLLARSPEVREAVRGVADLAGVRLRDRPGPDSRLVLYEDGMPEPQPAGPAVGAPVVRVGAGGIRLPGDERLLFALIAPHAAVGRIAVVAGWQGGAGATTLACALGTHRRAALVDLTRAAPGVALPLRGEDAPGPRWADLEPEEWSFTADLRDALPRVGAVGFLAADARGGAGPGDRLALPVVAALAGCGDVVVDVGRWDGAAASLVRAAGAVPVLVGRGGEAGMARLVGALATWPPGRGAHPPVLAVRGRASSFAAWDANPGCSTWTMPSAPRGRALGRLWAMIARAGDAAPGPGGRP